MIVFEGVEYDFINELNLERGLIDLGREEGGSMFTKLPISPKRCRKKYDSKYSVSHTRKLGVSIFEVTDDWGKPYIIRIDETLENMPFIEKNLKFCKDI